MTRKNKANLRTRLRWGTLSLGVAFLGGALAVTGPSLGNDKVPAPVVAEKPAAAPAVQMIVRGPDELVAGQQATLEIFLLNTGTTPVKDLELTAKFDPNLEAKSKESEQRIAIDPVASDDVQVVRIAVTPRKAGPGGVDLALREKNGPTQEVRQVWPVATQDPNRQPEPVAGASPLKFKITTLKECLADRPCIVLVNVQNTDKKAMASKLDLVLNYASMGRGAQVMGNPNPMPAIGPVPGTGAEALPRAPLASEAQAKAMMPMLAPQLAAGNPTRQAALTVPVLAAGESQTIPVRLTARRIGELGLAVTRPFKANEAMPAAMATARVKVKFDPNLPLEGLIPTRADALAALTLPKTLAEVPEVSLEDPAGPLKADEAFEYVSHLIEKINHVNTGKKDAFVEGLIRERPDMKGMPFVMGDDCRLTPERGQHFLNELSTLRSAMTNPANLASLLPNPTNAGTTDDAIHARIAALVQVTGPEGEQVVKQEVKYLSSVSHVRSTTALARLAIFSEEESVRREAIAALATRREKDYSGILVAGLNYPWPAVAQRSAEAIVELKRQDLLPQLVEVLDRPDPRAPQVEKKDGKEVTVVREMVRINHLKNCLLCHSPADPAKLNGAVEMREGRRDALEEGKRPPRDAEMVRRLPLASGLTAPVALPNQPLPVPTPQSGYGQFTVPDTLLVFDVTYLRQDFSVKLPVKDAKPWPDQQRFDFLVRTRELTEKEAEAYKALLKPQDGNLTPYQSAAVASLRKLTGRDAEPTAEAWRKVLAAK